MAAAHQLKASRRGQLTGSSSITSGSPLAPPRAPALEATPRAEILVRGFIEVVDEGLTA